MSDQYPFFAYLSRMRYINRWGLMRNTFQENIQEHSHMVAVLAHALAVIRRDVFGGDADPGLAAAAALYHDAPEIAHRRPAHPHQVLQPRHPGRLQGSGAVLRQQAAAYAAGGPPPLL